MKNKFAGLFVLSLIIILGVWVNNKYLNTASTTIASPKKQVIISGLAENDIKNLLDDSEIQKLLLEQWGLKVKVSSDTDLKCNPDFTFTSKQNESSQSLSEEVIFYSPIVLYSWNTITDAFQKQNLITEKQDSVLQIQLAKLTNVILQRVKWDKFNLPNIYGNIQITLPSPNKSSSGYMIIGLLANVINNDEIVHDSNLVSVSQNLKNVAEQNGDLPASSHYLFDLFLKTGENVYPLIAGDEHEIIGFSQQNPEAWNSIKDKVKILYPVPTVLKNYSVKTFNDKGVLFVQAMKDKNIQQIAWQKYGLRYSFGGKESIEKITNIKGIQNEIENVISIPKSDIMEKLLKLLK